MNDPLDESSIRFASAKKQAPQRNKQGKIFNTEAPLMMPNFDTNLAKGVAAYD